MIHRTFILFYLLDANSKIHVYHILNMIITMSYSKEKIENLIKFHQIKLYNYLFFTNFKVFSNFSALNFSQAIFWTHVLIFINPLIIIKSSVSKKI